MAPASSLLRRNLADNSQNQVLTFFDYLRQRAFESVLSGAQEALEVLENRHDRSEPSPGNSKGKGSKLGFQTAKPDKQAEIAAKSEESTSDDDELLPPPRRRGRPPRKSRGKQ